MNDKQEVLLAQRSLQKTINPGIWAVSVGGTVAAGDDYLETARRETEEELGVSGLELQEVKRVYLRDLTFGFRMCQLYVAKCNLAIEDFSIQQEEVAQIAWVPIEKALLMLIDSAIGISYATEYWTRLLPIDQLKK